MLAVKSTATSLFEEMVAAHTILRERGFNSDEYISASARLNELSRQYSPDQVEQAKQMLHSHLTGEPFHEPERHQDQEPHRQEPPSQSPEAGWGETREVGVGEGTPLSNEYASAFQQFMATVMNCPVVTSTPCEGHRVISIPFAQDLGAGKLNPWMESVLEDLKNLSEASPENTVLLESLRKTMARVPRSAAAKIEPSKFHSVVTGPKFKEMLVVQGGFTGPVSIGFGQGWYNLEIPKYQHEIKIANFADYAFEEGRYKPSDGLIARFAVDMAGRPIDIDLSEEPHVLVTGMTGSGKDMVLKAIAWDLMNSYSPAQVKFVTVDHQGLGVGRLSGTPWSWRGGQNVSTFEEYERMFVEIELECIRRTEVFKDWDVEDINDYNTSAVRRGAAPMPRLVVMVTEMMHFMVNDQTPLAKSRRNRMVAQARKFGIHFVFSSQRPFGVIGPAIRSEFGNVISLRLQRANDSEELFGTKRALELAKKGDALYKRPDDVDAIRVQTLYISRETYKAVWKSLQSPDLKKQWESETKEGTIFLNTELYDEYLGTDESQKAA